MEKVIVMGRHQAHEICFMVVSILLGINYLLVTIPPPQSLSQLAPRWVVVIWSIGLIISGGLGIPSALWRSNITVALACERAALIISSVSLSLIFIAILVANQTRGAYGAALTLAWIVANVIRTTQIKKEIRTLENRAGGEP